MDWYAEDFSQNLLNSRSLLRFSIEPINVTFKKKANRNFIPDYVYRFCVSQKGLMYLAKFTNIRKEGSTNFL